MELFVNDHSLHGQFSEVNAFKQPLKTVMSCGICAGDFRRRMYVGHGITRRMVGPQLSFREAVMALNDAALKSSVMRWIDRNGPFLEDTLTHNLGELYMYREDVVTEAALGEVAARVFDEQPAAVVSFAPSNFLHTPLIVQWCHSDDDIDECEIENHWDVQTLRAWLEQQQEAVVSWSNMLSRARTRYTNLTFFDKIGEHLDGEPFSLGIAERVLVLLDILNRLKGSFDTNGRRTAEGELLVQNFFQRKNALFSDASETEKKDEVYRARMTFRLASGESIECFDHGKIKQRQFRIHYSSIRPEAPLYIAYIGQKLTKK